MEFDHVYGYATNAEYKNQDLVAAFAVATAPGGTVALVESPVLAEVIGRAVAAHHGAAWCPLPSLENAVLGAYGHSPDSMPAQ